ncbi:sigma-70 family RNA polymerase sigma factor [Brucepastera parasyntrophica]|uniref:RNA polymerase sigma factor n=1 Tax=Brucepastera parasyntrophica TaxID=2880008 RepID=UPI00210BE7DA|nr:sigma-70 family RNA polymerase sigma factor [Brucepastera parasyntrophica]ULQ60658.1 sigma-70 family RNA polymerase sigma factor [Brucepastera parasyntrophica]
MDELDSLSLREGVLSGGERAQKAFLSLWEYYYKRLLFFAGSYRGLPYSEYEDAVADTLIAVFLSLARYDPSKPLSPWVYRIAANRFSDAARRAKRISPVLIGESDGNFPSLEPSVPDTQVSEAVAKDLLEKCKKTIDTLPETDRRIAYLKFYENMNAKEIGTILKLPPGTVRWKIYTIRNSIAVSLGEDYGRHR